MSQFTPRHSRAARGWLGWTQANLAVEAEIGLSTVKTFELGGTISEEGVERIRRAFMGAGTACGSPQHGPTFVGWSEEAIYLTDLYGEELE